VSKDKQGVVTRDKLTKHWTDWVDYWAVDFDYESRPEIIHEPRSIKTGEPLPGWQPGDEFVEFVPVQQGSFIFENEWQSFRTRKDRNLELTSAHHIYPRPGRYIVAVKVIDIFGNDTMTLIPVNVH
jgi:site-specific DNA-methyltransferase (adenine-specific)/adenine-specific DNA-methyltransferase